MTSCLAWVPLAFTVGCGIRHNGKIYEFIYHIMHGIINHAMFGPIYHVLFAWIYHIIYVLIYHIV